MPRCVASKNLEQRELADPAEARQILRADLGVKEPNSRKPFHFFKEIDLVKRIIRSTCFLKTLYVKRRDKMFFKTHEKVVKNSVMSILIYLG